MDGDAELARDHLVRGALGHQGQHVELARRQLDVADPRGPFAGHDRDRGLSRRRKAKAGDAAEQRRQPLGQSGIVDLERDRDVWPRLLANALVAHVSGLSATVTLKLTGSPPRRTATSTVEPTLSGPSLRDSARTPDNP